MLPRLRQVRAEKLKHADIVAPLDDLARHTRPTAAIETRKWLSSLFSWSLEKGRIATIPLAGLRAPVKSKPRERVLSHRTLHDLRRTAATHMTCLGVDDIVVERVPGHRFGGVKTVGNRYRYLEQKHTALTLWARERAGEAASDGYPYLSDAVTGVL